jgi:hypothetical protein
MDRLSDMLTDLVPESPDRGTLVWAECVSVDMPCEVYVRRTASGAITVEATAPSQSFRTSILPVFHHLKVTITASEGAT